MSVATIDFHGGDYEHVLGLSGAREGIDIRYVERPLLEIFEGMLNERRYECCEFSLANYIMLKDRGADWAEMRWVASGRQRFQALAGVPLEVVETDLEEDLVAGRIDALLTPTPADVMKPAGERRLRSLIADVQKAEEDYVREHGVYPINHVVVIRDDALRRLPKLPKALFTAFADAKARAYKRRLGTTLMPWGMRHWNKVFDQFGGNPLPYGLNAVNRDVVGRLAGFLHDQKLISKKPSVDELFIPESRAFAE
jgi:4,5-dihydroxyphthalate decarboxylase